MSGPRGAAIAATSEAGSSTLRAVLLSTLLLPLGVPLISPVLPAFRAAIGITAPAAALLVTMYFVPGVLLAPVIGLLADRNGRRRILVPALVAFGLAGVAIALVGSTTGLGTAPTLGTIIALRVVQGTAAVGVIVVTSTLLAETFEGLRRNTALGLNFGVLWCAAAIYPLVGGVLAPYGWQTPFFVTVIALPTASLVAIQLPAPRNRATPRGTTSIRRALAAIPRRHAIGLYGATIIIEAAAFGAVFTALPFLLATEFTVSPLVIGGVITTETLVAALVAVQNGRLAQHVANETMVALGIASFSLGLLAAWAAPTPLHIGASAIPMGVGVGLVLPSVDAAISEAVPAEDRAGVFGLRASSTFLGRATGPILFTGIAVATGYRVVLLAAGVLVALAGIGGLIAARTPPPATGR